MTQNSPIYDLHVHTEYSPDSSTPFDAYARLADQLSIHVGFLDHFELAFLERPGYLNLNQLPRLLEDYDRVHTDYPQTTIGLEIDYYSDLAPSVAEFCDDYRKDFDYFIGVVHTVHRLAVTTFEEMDLLVKRIGLQQILEQYFHEVKEAIQSQLFEGIAHIDGVMRFLPLYSGSHGLEPFWQNQTRELGLLCKKLDVLIEINLRGLYYPWGQWHPSRRLINELIREGAKFYVGSDSHNLQDLIDAEPQIKGLQAYLVEQNSFSLPGPL